MGSQQCGTPFTLVEASSCANNGNRLMYCCLACILYTDAASCPPLVVNKETIYISIVMDTSGYYVYYTQYYSISTQNFTSNSLN